MNSERGSVTPFFAIAGAVIIISVFWVDNVSYSMLEKIRQVSSAAALARMALISDGLDNNNVRTILSAVNVEDKTARYNFTSNVDLLTMKQMKELRKTDHLYTPLKSSASTEKTVDVPFTDINDSIGLDKYTKISTFDRSIKLIKPLNVVLAVENTRENEDNFSRSSEPLMNAFTRLLNDAPGSKVSVIPYSFRINSGGYCYTGISRGDNFSFSWWENYFYQEELLKSLLAQLQQAKFNLEWFKNNITSFQSQLSTLNRKLSGLKPGTGEYQSTVNAIRDIENKIKDSYMIIEKSKSDIQKLNIAIPKQEDVVYELQGMAQYQDYLPLAKHYAKQYDNYQLLEDYNDEFANSDGYSISQSDFAASASNVTKGPFSLKSLAVNKNGFFADSDTCPSVPVLNNSSSYYDIKKSIASLDFTNDKLKTVEGILAAGRQANNSGGTNKRSVVMVFASSKKEALDDGSEAKGLLGVNAACAAIKSSWYQRVAVKTVFVVSDGAAKEKFSAFNCTTPHNHDYGFIVLDDIKPTSDQSFSDILQSKFFYILSQESTSRDAQP